MRLGHRATPRKLLNRALALANLEVRRKPRALIRSNHELELTPDLVASDLAVRTAGQQLTVLQIGAHDGVTGDPIAALLSRFGWRAILVEPQPEPCARLRDRYASNPNVIVRNVAVADTNGDRELFSVRPGPGVPDWVAGVASFSREHVEKQRDHVAAGVPFAVARTRVETLTFESLLNEHGVNTVDILQIDVEGYDYELLKLFNVPRWLPAIINYEHVHLSRADREAAVQLLASHGYLLAMSFSGGDTLAYRPPAKNE